MKKILCCIPTLGNIRIELAQRLYQWKVQYGDFFDIYSSFKRPLYEARNECVRAFQDTNASYLFFVDSDVVPSINVIDMLLSHSFDKKIIGSLCFEIKVDRDGILKKVPMALQKVKNGYKIIDESKLKGLINVDATSTQCVMIHHSVFKSIDPPWFEGIAEDFYFYEKAKEAGVSIYIDCDCNAKHYMEVGI
jgi:hypothetical protein